MNLESLSAVLSTCPYPKNVAHIERGIKGNGYYPGASGFAQHTDPTNGVMLLGRDFGSFSYYAKRSQIPNADETMFTWRMTAKCILPSLDWLGVWAVNYLMGARKQSGATENLRGLTSPDEWVPYERFCWDFLARMVLLQKPRCLVVLGKYNEIDLTTTGRIDGDSHTFKIASDTHVTKVVFAGHPASFQGTAKELRATAWYQDLASDLIGP